MVMKRIMTGKTPVPACSLVIRAYNEGKHIGRLFDGIAQQTMQDVEIIVVDSGSSDETIKIAEQHKSNVVKIQPEQFSFGRSLNLGISHANADLIVIVSAHVYPIYPDWLENLLDPFKNPKIALTYGKQRGNTTSRFSEQQILRRWYPEGSQLYQTHPFCNNANAAIRKSLWQEHPYDESLSGLEDLAWARWAIGAGYNLAYIAEAEVIHVHDENPTEVFNRYRREAMAFKKIFPHEQFKLGDFFRLATSNILSDIWQATRQKISLSNFLSIGWFRLMQFWGTYQGYRQSGPLTERLRRTFYYPHRVDHRDQSTTRDVQPIHYNDTDLNE